MAKNSSRTAPLLIALALSGGLAACAGAPARQDEAKPDKFPVQWTQEFNMPSLLDQPPAIRSKPDLRKLLELPWYTGIAVATPASNDTETVVNCNEYFELRTDSLRAHQPREQNALLELKAMCQATRLLSEASPARQSNIPTQPLDALLPVKLPESLALVTSQSELQRIKNDQSVAHWGEVNTLTEVNQLSTHKMEYRSDAGIQNFSILGRGDIDGDGWEDLVVTVEDTVEGGSYFNLRLFVLTVTEQGDWQIVAMD